MRKLLSVLLLLPFAGVAQQPFSINGNIKHLKNGDEIYLIYNSGMQQFSDSTLVNNGVFKFKGTITEPVEARLYLNRNLFVRQAQRNKRMDSRNFYLEPGQIGLTATDSLTRAVISAGPINADNEKLSGLLEPSERKLESLNAKFFALTEEQRKDEKLVAKFTEELSVVWDEKTVIQYNFVKAHPKSYISLFLLRELIEIPKYFSELKKIVDGFTPVMKASPSGQLLVARTAVLEKRAIGTMAMDFELNDANSKPVKLSDFKGKYVLLDFWASWCRPCRKENPHILAAYQEYKDKGFTVLGVSGDNDKKAWAKAVADDKLEWTQLCDDGKDDFSPMQKYGINRLPSNFLIDPTGKIVAAGLRGKELQEKLKKLLN